MGLVPLASGDIFRAEIEAGSPLGKKAQEFILKGQLVPDAVTIGMMRTRVTNGEAVKRGFVLDGFPRTVSQAVALDVMLEEIGVEIDRVVSLELGDEVIIKRLSGRRLCKNCGELYHLISRPPREDGVCDKCGSDLTVRKDDVPNTIRQRLTVFHETTAPVLKHYEKKGKVMTIDGGMSSEDVYAVMTQGLVS